MKNILLLIILFFMLNFRIFQISADEIPDCSRTFCGCWEEVILDFNTKILNEQKQPLKDIEIYCDREKTPISISNAIGVAKFKISTKYSPGCHYEKCSHLIFRDINSKYKDHRLTVYQANGQDIFLTLDK